MNLLFLLSLPHIVSSANRSPGTYNITDYTGMERQSYSSSSPLGEIESAGMQNSKAHIIVKWLEHSVPFKFNVLYFILGIFIPLIFIIMLFILYVTKKKNRIRSIQVVQPRRLEWHHEAAREQWNV